MGSSPRTIAIMVGSDSDLAQCEKGFEYLLRAERNGLVDVQRVITASIHRNTYRVLEELSEISNEGIDVLIVGAGWANHLTGVCDAVLRYELRNTHTVVVGVAFRDDGDIKHTDAAVASIVHVPGSQVVFRNFVGDNGFLRACQFAALDGLPAIEERESKRVIVRTLSGALSAAQSKKQG